MKKYYHTIFLGLIDMALVNAYIIHRRVKARLNPGRAPPTHAEFMRSMQVALLNVGAADFEGDLSVEALVDTSVVPSTHPRYTLPAHHTPRQVDIFRTTRAKTGKESSKRRQYGCKVCSLLRPAKTPWETTFYCVECSEERMNRQSGARGKIYLCQKVRQHDPSGSINSATCSQIWHNLWGAGARIPPGLKTIRMRSPSGSSSRRTGENIDDSDEEESSANESSREAEIEVSAGDVGSIETACI